jgi:signal transduction histidine kinase
MRSLRTALLAVGALGAVLIGVALAITLSSDHNEGKVATAVIGTVIMSSFIGVGLFAWWRRPNNRFGMLMTAVGFVAFLGALQSSNVPALFDIGVFLGGAYLAVSAHMLLAFPTGRLETRVQRWLVGATYGLIAAVALAYALFSPDCGCEDVGAGGEASRHPPNVFNVADAAWVAETVDLVGSLAGVGITLAIGVILLRRWRAASRHGRRALAPVLWTGAIMIGLLMVALALDATAWNDEPQDVLELLHLIAFAALPWAFLIGLLRSRYWRAGAVGELVEAVGEAPRGAQLRDALAEALGDPSLQLAYWLPDTRRYVDAEGHALELPEPGDRRAATEVERDGRRIAAIVHDASLCDDPELVRAVGAAAALALENERLDAELRARVDDLQRSRRHLLEAGLAERRRLERDLHDGAQQRLVALSLQLGLVRSRLAEDPERARELLDAARDEARAALEDLRELARGIHPAILTDRGLGAALEALADRAPLPVAVRDVPDERLPPAVEAAAYFVVAESLTNVAKYARAGAAEVRVDRRNGHAIVEVRDDGVGGADPGAGTGLRGLAERLAALDGRLEVSSPPGGGTVVRAEVPCGPS